MYVGSWVLVRISVFIEPFQLYFHWTWLPRDTLSCLLQHLRHYFSKQKGPVGVCYHPWRTRCGSFISLRVSFISFWIPTSFPFLVSPYSNLATFCSHDKEYSFLSCQNKSLGLNHGNRFKIALCFYEYVLLPRTQFRLVFFVSFSQRSVLPHFSFNTGISPLPHKTFSPFFCFFPTDSLPCCLTFFSTFCLSCRNSSVGF